MSEFKFSCPFCSQHLQCEERLCGRQIQCPACNHLIRIPPSVQRAVQGDYTPESGHTWATFIAPPNVEKPKGVQVEPKDKPAPPPP